MSELKSWIGREVTYTAPEDIGLASIRYFALALDDDNPIYCHADAAASTRHGSIIAPPTFVCETNQIVNGPQDQHGYFGHRWDLPLDNSRFMRGGNEYSFFRPVRPTDRVSVRWKLMDIIERETDRLGPMIFITSEARYYDQDGELLATNLETNIYKP